MFFCHANGGHWCGECCVQKKTGKRGVFCVHHNSQAIVATTLWNTIVATEIKTAWFCPFGCRVHTSTSYQNHAKSCPRRASLNQNIVLATVPATGPATAKFASTRFGITADVLLNNASPLEIAVTSFFPPREAEEVHGFLQITAQGAFVANTRIKITGKAKTPLAGRITIDPAIATISRSVDVSLHFDS